MNRITLYVGVPETQNPRTALESAGASVRASTAGGWRIAKDGHLALAIPIGRKTVSGTAYRVFALLIYQGEQYRAYRWLKGVAGFVGPFTRHNAPAALKTLLREISATRALDGSIIALGEPVTALILAGELRAVIDRLDYREGTNPDGSLDSVVEIA